MKISTARAGGGSTQISGGATLSAFRPTEWRFDITANDAEALWRGVQAAIDANLTLTGTPQGQTLSGRVTITTAEYTSSELSLVELGERGRLRFGSFGGVRGRRERRHPPISLDVTVEARESFLIRSDQVNAVASATLRLAGPLADPEISGRVTFDGGAVIFRGRRYDITSGWLELSGGYEDPRLQLQAEGNIRGYRVIIGISGPINSLDLTLNSEPRLSRAEIISLITMGSVGSGAFSAPDPARAGLTTAGALSEEFISKPWARDRAVSWIEPLPDRPRAAPLRQPRRAHHDRTAVGARAVFLILNQPRFRTGTDRSDRIRHHQPVLGRHHVHAERRHPGPGL